MKRCTKCGEERPLSEFNSDRSRKDGKHPWCKPCARAKRAAWYEKNREVNLAYQAGWRAENAAKKAAGDRRWREANRDAHSAQQKAYRDENRETRSAYFAARHQAHKDDPEYRQGRQRLKAARRARLAGVEHQPYTRREIWERDGGVCRLCQTPVPFGSNTFHIDHIVPIALLGPDIPANLQLLCQPCNNRKAAKLDGQIHLPV